MPAADLIDLLKPQEFSDCSSMEDFSTGWVPPRDNAEIVHPVDGVFVLEYKTEKRLLPSIVINTVLKERAEEVEEQQGFAPGRKQKKELKEQVRDELLPRAFAIPKLTRVMIDPKNGWILVDSTNQSVAEDILKLLLKAIPKFPIESIRTKINPVSAMTTWLAQDSGPAGFTIDQDAVLQSTGEGKATVRYSKHTLEPEDLGRHISAGKECVKLAMTWSDKVSFVLSQDLKISRLTLLGTIKESVGQNAEERFDSDIMLHAGLINEMLNALMDELGGLIRPDIQEPLAA